MSLKGYIYTLRKRKCQLLGLALNRIEDPRIANVKTGWVTTVNDVPVGETGHNLHAPSPQEAKV